MPRVQFSRPMEGINKNRAMPVPKRVQELTAWFREARRTFPDIPDAMSKTAEWMIANTMTTEHTIMFELLNKRTEERAAVVIDSRAPYIGGT